MLDGMRRMSQGLVGRIIMGLVMGFISLSFAIWGVGNIFIGYGSGKAAQVGKIDISTDQVRQLYQTRLQQLQQQARRAITNDEAHVAGLDRQVMNQLLSSAALDGKADKLGLAISDKDIAQKILVEPGFAGPTGKFDPNKFNEVLRQNGFNEASFVFEQRRTYLRQDIADALTGDMIVPDAALQAIHRFRDETRSLDYFELPASAAGDIPAPDDATLQAYFDSRKQGFRAPEYRGIVTLAVEPRSLAEPAAISDAAARKKYDEVKTQRYLTPATRHAEQVVFKDEGSAKQASEKIKAGATLASVAEDMKLPVADLGSVTKTGVFDQALAETIFALPEGGDSEPVKNAFGYTILHVISATPESVRSFEDAGDEIKGELAREAAKKTVGDIRDKIEDERTSGKPLEEAAAAAGQKAVAIAAIDRAGLDKSGTEVAGLVDREALLKAVFASNIGVDNDTLTTSDGGYVWFEVTSVEPARDQLLSEVKDKVANAWKEDEISRRISEKADALAKRIDAGEALSALAQELGLEAKSAADVKRIGTTSVPQTVVLRAFALPVGQAGSASGQGDGRIVFKVLGSVTPDLNKDSDVMKAVTTQLKQSYADDLLGEYLARAQSDAGVTINQAEVRSATGVSDSGDQ